jgi:hypothetical protein
MTAISAYPLCWPSNVPRAQRREAGGSHEAMARINAARDAALKERA